MSLRLPKRPRVSQTPRGTPEGDAAQAGQTSTQPEAEVSALGAAAALESPGPEAGAPLETYRAERSQPLAVLLDNVNGYPQSGLREASAIFEMPVEGGLTRLMTVYDRADPGPVGTRAQRPRLFC